MDMFVALGLEPEEVVEAAMKLRCIVDRVAHWARVEREREREEAEFERKAAEL